MGKRDLLFLSLIVGGGLALASSLVPPRARVVADTKKPIVEAPDIVDPVNRSFRERWTEQGLKPTSKAPKLAVMRRLSLALTGVIPSLEEIRRFESRPPEARLSRWLEERLVDRRTADYLAERLARAYVGVENGPFIVFRRRRFVSWLSDELLKNRPYDVLVRDLIASRGVWTDHPATNFISVTLDQDKKIYDPERLAARVARAFLGVRIDCAQCHDHPFQPWKRTDFRGLTAYFGQVEHTFTGINDGKGEFQVDDKKDGKLKTIEPKVPFLPELDPKTGTRRERLARWVTDPKNPNFSRATVNRTWAILFGKPLVEPIDDIASAGEIPPVLQILADDFASHGFDLRRLIRAIASTEAFTIDSATDSESESSSIVNLETAWASFPITRLRPEQVAGALLQSASISTIDASSHILIRLATYGGVNDFVNRHGDPGEEEFNLESSSTIPQRLLMMNGDLVNKSIKEEIGNATGRIAMLAPDDRKAVETAYLVTLTRRPTPAEATYFESKLTGTKGHERTERMTDLIWVLLNATEFSWDH